MGAIVDWLSGLGLDVEAFAQCSLALQQVKSYGLPDFEVGQHAIACEFVDVSQRQTAMCGDLVAGFLRGWEAGSYLWSR